jgi:hypothetical protein
MLVEAVNIEEDNYILQPYLDEWQAVYDDIFFDCVQQYGNKYGLFTQTPTVSPAPSATPTSPPSVSPSASPTPAPTQSVAPSGAPVCAVFELDTIDPDLEVERDNGIMFDIENTSDRGTSITALDVMLWNNNDSQETVTLYIKQGSWQDGDNASTNVNAWTLVESVQVEAQGKFNPTSMPLTNPILLESSSVMGVYIVQTSNSDLYGITYDDEADPALRLSVGNTSATSLDTILELKVGQGVAGDTPFDTSNDFLGSRGFIGTVYYDMCPGSFRDTGIIPGGGVRPGLGVGGDAVQKDGDAAADGDLERRLDHKHIDAWYGSGANDPEDFSKDYLHWDPFRLWTSPWFVRYRGSLTMPQCFDDTRVRVLDRPLQISQKQMTQIDTLIAGMRNPLGSRSNECQLATVGKPRDDGTNFVNVNRPLQSRTRSHDMKYCNSGDFSQREFFRTPRGNTCWCLLQGTCPEGCGIDCAGNCYASSTDQDADQQGREERLPCDEHWHPDEIGTWDAKKCRSNNLYTGDDRKQ